MVSIFSVSGHPARELSQMPLGASGPALLKPAFESIRPLSGISDLLAGMDLAITINGKVLDSEIYAKNINRIIRGCFGDLNNDTEIEYVFNHNKVCLTPNSVKPSLLIAPQSHRNSLPALESNQRYILKPFPRENALIINNSAIKPKFRLDRLISLISFTDLGNSSNSKLSGETKMFSNRIVNSLMDLNLVSTMQSENSLSYVIASLVKPFHCFTEQLMLLWGGFETHHQGLKHCIEDILQGINSF